MATGEYKLRVSVDGVNQAQGQLKNLGGTVNEIGKSVGRMVGAFVSIYAATKAIKYVIENVKEEEAAVISLNAALSNTGIYSDNFSKALRDNASALQGMTIYADEAIIAGTALAQNIGNLSAEQLPAAQKAAIGLAAAFNMDLQTAFQMVGKAAAGNTATLARYGIVLDEGLSAEEKFNKVLEMGASKFSLAEAAATSFGGRIAQMKNAMSDMAENIGYAVLPALTEIAKSVSTMFQDIGPVLDPLLKSLSSGFAKLVPTVMPLLQSLVGMLGAILPGAIDFLTTAFAGMMPVLGTVTKALADVIKWFASLNGITKAALVLTPLLVAAWRALAVSAIGLAVANKGLSAALGVVSGALATAKIAVQLFFMSIGPVSWAIMGLGAAIGALGLILAHNKKKMEENTQASEEMQGAISNAAASAKAEEIKFRALGDRLLELKRSTNQTAESKREMKGVIDELNSRYGQYISNIDLETASYSQLERAVTNAANAIIAKTNAEAYGAVYSNAAQEYAKAMQKVIDKYGPEFAEDMIKTPSRFFKPDWPKVIKAAHQALLDMEAAETAYRAKLKNTTTLTPKGPGKKDTGSGAGSVGGLNEITGAVTDAEKAYKDFWAAVNKFAQSDASSPLQPLINDMTEYLTLLGEAKDTTLGLSADDINIATKILDTGYINRITNATYGLQEELTNMVDDAETDRIAIIRRGAQKQIDAITATKDQVEFLIESIQEMWGTRPVDPAVAEALRRLTNLFVQLESVKNKINANANNEVMAAEAESAADAADKLNAKLQKQLEYSQLLTDNAVHIGLTYGEYYDERKKQIDAEIQGLADIYGMTKALADLQDIRIANIGKEWEELQTDKWIGENEELYDGINRAVEAMTDGFATMIKEGKTFEETMGDIFKAWVDIAIQEVERLITRLIMAAIIKQIVGVGTGGGSYVMGAVTGLASGGYVQGYGTGTSDQNLIAVSNGEYVVNASATRQNRQLLDAINSGATPTDDTLVNEVRMLRRELRSGLNAPVRMSWRRGEMSRAVAEDAQHRRAI